MLQEDECKACQASVRLSKEEIELIFGNIIKVKDVKLASDELYARRLGICNECPALQYGTTCKYCGCLMPVKAKLAGAKCPWPFEPRW